MELTLTPAQRDLQQKVRDFISKEVMPLEVEVEMAEGKLDPAVRKRLYAQVKALGLNAISLPGKVGGRGFSWVDQAIVNEELGKATNALGWVLSTPPLWFTEVASPMQRERWLAPTVRGELHECYAITEEGAGSDVDAIQATARRDGDGYVVDGVKWHVT